MSPLTNPFLSILLLKEMRLHACVIRDNRLRNIFLSYSLYYDILDMMLLLTCFLLRNIKQVLRCFAQLLQENHYTKSTCTSIFLNETGKISSRG
jgi:hypothetical protein